MRKIIELLHAAQATLLKHAPGTAEHRLALQRLRAQIPAPILAHYLRLVEQGRSGVALVRHGVCSSCHIRVASGLVAALVKPEDVHLCDQCGCYLLLPEEEIPPPHAAPPPVVEPRRRGRKQRNAVTA
ncbi:MAG: hypothetical protein Q7S40_25870 [Opitutaceae bacterium]|nr:hypothetical protein [Opitutaceae bacterium]